MKKIAYLLLLVISATTASSQKLDFNTLKGLHIRNIGPAGMSGRVTSIDVVRHQPQVMFIGTASGGVWKSESGGMTWKPVFDEMETQSIGSVAICQQNPDVVWVGTGEGNPRNTQNSGKGIYRSLDGGKTWKHMGLPNSRTIHRILIDPTDCHTVYAGVNGSAWGPNKERGVFKTTNGGETWEQVLYVNDTTGCADLVMDPSNPNKLIAAMWQYHRQPYTFTSGGKGSGLYITHDGGKTWGKRSHKQGLPKGELGRIGLAIAASNPNVIYALVEHKERGLYRSDDGGLNWKTVATKNIGNRPFYYSDIFVDPKDENTLYNLYSVVSKSIDGGRTFKTILPYSGVHPDHHAWYIHPDNPHFMINGNDGGLNITTDGGKNWRFVGNLPLGQFYHVNVDNEMPYNVYGGLQDNGSWIGPSQVWQSGGIRNHHWLEVLFGDGFDVMPRGDDSRYAYAMYQGGNLYMIDRQTGENMFIRPNHPEGKPLRFNWNAALAQDPFDKQTIYYGSQYVHRSKNGGFVWDVISPDLTTNDTTKQKQAISGGITIDATAAENYTTILAIEPAPTEKGVIWVGTDDGNLQVTTNDGQTWTNVIGNIKGAPKGAWIPYIQSSRHRKGEAFVVINDYRRNNWKPFAFRTTDYGKTWTRIADETQIGSFVLSVLQDPVEPNLFFLGADDGLYVSVDGARNWNKWNKGFPSVPVSDMKIQERESDLVLGTFGRAIWILDDITPLREMAKDNNLTDRSFKLFQPDTAYMASYKGVAGERFDADTEFKGQNQGRGAMFYVWLKEPKNPEAKKQDKEAIDEQDSTDKDIDWEKIHITLTHHDRDDIYVAREFTVKADTGLHRIWWHFEKNGVRWPSWQDADEKADKPWGDEARPGTYQLRVQYGDMKDSAMFTVNYDPRTWLRDKQLKGKAKWLAKVDTLASISSRAFDQMRHAKGTVATINGMLDKDSKQHDALRKKGKELTETLTAKKDV